MRMLLVEADHILARALVSALRREAYAVDLATDGSAADRLHFVNTYDLILLGRNIPAPGGADLLRQWRARGDGTPVLMLSASATVSDRVLSLDTGADDCLSRPFAMTELLARVRSLLRRRSRLQSGPLEIADVHMNRAAHEVTVAGRQVKLSPKEFSLLEFFLSRPDEVVSRTELLEHSWDDAFDGLSNVVDVTIHRLRSKIDGDRRDYLLRSVKGVGYVLHSQRN